MKEEKKETEAVEVEVVDATPSTFPNNESKREKEVRDLKAHIVRSRFIYGTLSLIMIVAYIVVGCLWWKDGEAVGWASGWGLLVLIHVLGSLERAIYTRNPALFNFPLLILVSYVCTGIIGNFYDVNLWGTPFWIEWLLVPVYYFFCILFSILFYKNRK